jgi:PAS domain-containing protein
VEFDNKMLEILTLILAIALGGVSYGYWRLRQSSVIQQARFVAAETEYARRLADKDTQIEQAKTDNDDQDKTISRLKTDLAQARNALAEQQATCVTLQAKISERDSELAAMGQKLADQMAVYEARLAEAHQQAQADQQNTQQTIATLRTQHLQDRALADSAYDALIVIDEHMQVLAMNAAAANLFPHEGADGDDRRKRLRLVELTKAPALEMMPISA